MEIDLTVNYYTKHIHGAGNAKKQIVITVMDFDTLDGRTPQSCHYCDVETSVKCLDVSQS